MGCFSFYFYLKNFFIGGEVIEWLVIGEIMEKVLKCLKDCFVKYVVEGFYFCVKIDGDIICV